MKTQTQKIVAEICLYGTHVAGAGWLAQLADGALLGDGEPRTGRTFTDAVWLACDAIIDRSAIPPRAASTAFTSQRHAE